MTKNTLLIFCIALAVMGLFTSHKALEQNKVLKREIKTLRTSINYLEAINTDLKELIKQDSLIISKKTNDIVKLNNNLTKIKQDETNETNTYINSDVDKRVRTFTSYATDTN